MSSEVLCLSLGAVLGCLLLAVPVVIGVYVVRSATVVLAQVVMNLANVSGRLANLEAQHSPFTPDYGPDHEPDPDRDNDG